MEGRGWCAGPQGAQGLKQEGFSGSLSSEGPKEVWAATAGAWVVGQVLSAKKRL